MDTRTDNDERTQSPAKLGSEAGRAQSAELTPAQKQIAAIRAICDAIVESVREAGDFGAPSGIVYAALMQYMSLDQYYQFIAGLVRAGKLRQEGDLLFAL